MKYKWKKAAAFTLALSLVAGAVPANLETGRFFGNPALTANADDKIDLSSATVTFNGVGKGVTVKIGDDVVPSTEYIVKYGGEKSSATETFPETSGKKFYAFVVANADSTAYTGECQSDPITIVTKSSQFTKILKKDGYDGYIVVDSNFNIGDNQITTSRNVIIDLNGKTITNDSGKTINSYSNLAIRDTAGNGAIKLGKGLISISSGTLTLESGTIESEYLKGAIYLYGDNCDFVMTGGTINSNNLTDHHSICVKDSGASVNISGGTVSAPFYAENGSVVNANSYTITGGTFAFDPTDFVGDKEKYVVNEKTPSDGWYTVTEKQTAVTYTEFPAKSATCTANGNIAYYLGSDGNYYSDNQGTLLTDQNNDNIVDEKDVIIPATDHEYVYSSKTNNADGSVTVTFACSHDNCKETKEETLSAEQISAIISTSESMGGVTNTWTWAEDKSSAALTVSDIPETATALLVASGIDTDVASYFVTNGITVPATVVSETTPATYEADGVITYTASVGSLKKEETVILPKLQMYMQLDPTSAASGNVDINIYAPIPEDANIEEYSIQFGDTVKPVSECETTTIGGKTYYLLKFAAPAKQMSDEYTYAVLKGEEIQKSGYTSIRSYNDTVLDAQEGTYSDVVLRTCRAMLAYGTAAQTYFGYNTDDFANKNHSTGNGADYSEVTIPENVFDKAALNTALENSGAPVFYDQMTLSLNADTTLSLYFKLNDGAKMAAAKSFVTDNFALDGKIVEENGTKYVVIRKRDIAIRNLMNSFELTYNGENYPVSAGQYLYAASQGGSDNLKQLVKALYNYHLAATNK